MKTKLAIVSFISLLIFLYRFSSAYAEQPNKAIEFGTLEKLQPGEATKEKTRQLLGEPKAMTDLSKSPSLKYNKDLGIVWEYYERDRIRLSVSFNSGTNTIDSWTWYLYESDSEKSVKTALLKFPGASWLSETVKWVNPHHYPNECFFSDNSKGISVEYNRTRENVSSITRWNPSRKPASSLDNEKPPRFCILDSCSNGILSKELFKDAPLCQLPK